MGVTTGQAEFVVHYTGAADPEEYINTFGVDPDTLEDGQTLTDDAEAFAGLWETAIMPFVASDVHMVRVDAVVGENGGNRLGTFVTDVEGGRLGAAEAQNVAYLVHKNTNAVGRGRSGRLYLPGVPYDKLDQGGIVQSSERNNISGAFNDLITDATYTYMVNHGEDSDLFPSTVITSFECDPLVATQRRRLRR